MIVKRDFVRLAVLLVLVLMLRPGAAEAQDYSRDNAAY